MPTQLDGLQAGFGAVFGSTWDQLWVELESKFSSWQVLISRLGPINPNLLLIIRKIIGKS